MLTWAWFTNSNILYANYQGVSFQVRITPLQDAEITITHNGRYHAHGYKDFFAALDYCEKLALDSFI